MRTKQRSPRDCVMASLRHQEIRPVPFWLGFQSGIAKRMDEHFGHDRWRASFQDKYLIGCDPIGSVVRPPLAEDPTLARDYFGSLWRIDGLAHHLEKPALAGPSLDRLPRPDPARLRNPERLERCRKFIANNREERYVGAAVWGTGLYETAWCVRGFEDSLADAAGDEVFYQELVDRIAEHVDMALDMALELPVDFVSFGDDVGDQNGVTIGPDRWRRYFKAHWARLCGKAHAAGKKVFLHSCGSVADLVPDLIEVGIDILDPVQPEPRGMNPYALKKAYGDRITFHGGLGSQTTIPFGTPSSIRDEIGNLCREMGRGGGYILKPAKAVRDETPLENALAVLDAFVNQETA
jgi:uroporphyrinogen decarboxylase